jgi:hypothetical protein
MASASPVTIGERNDELRFGGFMDVAPRIVRIASARSLIDPPAVVRNIDFAFPAAWKTTGMSGDR